MQHLLLSTLSNLQIAHESENDSTPTNEDNGIVDPPQASNALDNEPITQSSALPQQQQQSQSDRVNSKKPSVTQKPVPERRSRPPASQAKVKASSMSSKELPDSR